MGYIYIYVYTPFCVKYVLNIKVLLCVLKLMLIFAMSKGNKVITIKQQYYDKRFIYSENS